MSVKIAGLMTTYPAVMALIDFIKLTDSMSLEADFDLHSTTAVKGHGCRKRRSIRLGAGRQPRAREWLSAIVTLRVASPDAQRGNQAFW